jgi:hypothetical protein
VRAYVVASLFLVPVSGCTMHAAIKDPAPYVDQHQPKTIWIERSSAAVTQVDNPHISYFGDTIIGFTNGKPVRIPIGEVTRASVTKTDWVTTGLCIAALAGAFVAVDVPGQFSKGKGGL